MRHLFFAIIACLGLAFASAPAEAGKNIRYGLCDKKLTPECWAYKNPSFRGPRPTTVRLVCIEFVQNRGDVVTHVFRDADDERAPPKWAPFGRFERQLGKRCFGAWRFESIAASGQFELCNGVSRAFLHPGHIRTLLSLGRMPGGTKMCLLDARGECSNWRASISLR